MLSPVFQGIEIQDRDGDNWLMHTCLAENTKIASCLALAVNYAYMSVCIRMIRI